MLKQAFALTALTLTVISGTAISRIAIAQNSPRSGYRVINTKDFVTNKKLSALTPNQVASKLFSYAEEAEGRKAEQVGVTYTTRNTAVIMHTEEGLADDSVAAQRKRVEMQRIQNQWRVVWVGEQYKCQPNRGGNINWSGKLCP